jgi:hypothetical protein
MRCYEFWRSKFNSLDKFDPMTAFGRFFHARRARAFSFLASGDIPMTIGMAAALRNSRNDAITTLAGASAKLRIYSGTRPATGGTATTLLAELICNATFAPGSSAGVLTLNSIANGTAVASGTATWARLVKADGTTHVLDMDVGTSGSDVNLNATAIASGATVSVTSAVFTDGNP